MVALYLSSDVNSSATKLLRDLRLVYYNTAMSTLLDKAFEKARELPEPDQDIAAAELLGVLADFPTPVERAAIAEGRAQYERGEYITHEQWRHEMGLDNR
jgi:hypothetical protein